MSRDGTSRTVAVASAVVSAVLVVLTAVAATTVTSIRDSQREVERLSTVVTVWRDLQLAVSEEAFAEAGYRRAPSDDARARLDLAVDAVPAMVAAARAVGDVRDSTTLDRVTALNARYVAEVRRTLDDLPAAGGEDRVAGPALDAVSEVLAGAVQAHRERAAQARTDQAERTRLMLWLVPSGTALGALALGVCWWTLVRKHRRLAASAAVTAIRAAQDPLTGLPTARRSAPRSTCGSTRPSRAPSWWSISTGSRRSTTPWATRPATRCCWPWPTTCARSCAPATWWAAWAATSSPSCSPRPPGPTAWPSRSSWPWPTWPSPTTSVSAPRWARRAGRPTASPSPSWCTPPTSACTPPSATAARSAVPYGPVAGSRLCRDAVAGGLITRQARTSTTGHP